MAFGLSSSSSVVPPWPSGYLHVRRLSPHTCNTQSQAAMHIHHRVLVGAIVLISLQSAVAQQTAPPISAESRLSSEVVEAERLAKVLRASADKVDNEVWLGTMFNDVDLPEHTCYSLGVLLGIEANVRHLRFDRSRRSARTPDEANELRVRAQSLDNFASAAKASLKESEGKRSIAWNLDCAEKYGFSHRPNGDPTFYEVINDGRGIQILGSIEAGFTERLKATLARAPNAKFVALGSGGGSVAEAIASGRLIRSRGLATTIWNNCYSACPLVFLGGVDRHIHSPYPSLGFHQISTPTGALPKSSHVYARVAEYIREMGASDQFVITSMLRAAPAEMNMINGADVRLCRERVATWIQRACDADR
jgi:hypothetical protein